MKTEIKSNQDWIGMGMVMMLSCEMWKAVFYCKNVSADVFTLFNTYLRKVDQSLKDKMLI